MLVEFDEEFELPVKDVYPYFKSPVDWPRLFKALGNAVFETGNEVVIMPDSADPLSAIIKGDIELQAPSFGPETLSTLRLIRTTPEDTRWRIDVQQVAAELGLDITDTTGPSKVEGFGVE